MLAFAQKMVDGAQIAVVAYPTHAQGNLTVGDTTMTVTIPRAPVKLEEKLRAKREGLRYVRSVEQCVEMVKDFLFEEYAKLP